jgi:pimeloyl-ACP methyl ester carboxylesterase
MKVGKVAAIVAAGAGAALGLGYLFSAFARKQVERRAPPVGGFVTIDGVRLHYVEAGSGPAIVLIHGLGGQLRNFSYALLTRRPGAGYSPRMAGYGLSEHAAIVARFITEMDLDRPVVVGHSLGGAVALALGLDHPDLIRRLVLLAPLSQPEMVVQQPFKTYLAAPSWLRNMACKTAAVPLGAAIRHRVQRVVFAPEAVPSDFDEAGGAVLALRSDALAAGFDEISTARAQLALMAARYTQITLRVRILFGRGDQLLDPAIHGTLTASQIPGARLTMMDGGHMLPITQPDAVARFILSED